MEASDLKGIVVPIVTPLTSDDMVDYDGLRRVVNHVIEGGVHIIFTLGSTGNFPAFSRDERVEIARTVVEETAGRVLVVAGCTDSITRTTLMNVEALAPTGIDAFVLEPPYLFPCTDEDVLNHYRAVATASPLPIVIYDNPGDTKVALNPQVVTHLAEDVKFLGIKDSSYDFVKFQQLLSCCGSPAFSILQGIEALAGPSFLWGADGGVLAFANVLPSLCVALYEAGHNGDLAETKRLQDKLNGAYSMLKTADGTETAGTFFGGIQAALNILGICQKTMTIPYSPFDANQVTRVRNILSTYV
jgi:dihydrodipicolinate synthase/N-acetylneuraminate lyase